MAWFKVDDRLYSHPKWMATPARARALWVTAGSWCAAEATDGRIPRSALPLLGGTAKDAAALVAARLWRENKDGWVFHEWTIYQPDAASEKAKRKADSDAGILGNHRRWHAKRRVIVPDCPYCNGVSEDDPPMPPEEDETHRPPDRGPDRPPDDFSIGSASLVPVPNTPSDSSVGGGSYVSSAAPSQIPPIQRCGEAHPSSQPCNRCGDLRKADKAQEAAAAQAAKEAKRQADAEARRQREAEAAATERATPEQVAAAKSVALGREVA